MKIKFNDGVEFETAGKYRVAKRHDGWYVVGGGMVCPVYSAEDGMQMIAELTELDGLKRGRDRHAASPGVFPVE